LFHASNAIASLAFPAAATADGAVVPESEALLTHA
jgi:hypothetical protein